MEQMLPRGYALTNEQRVKRRIAGTDTWEIYTTNSDCYVIAVTENLLSKWTGQGFVEENMFFSKTEDPDIRIFIGSSGYMVSSMEHGPFPSSSGQIEAFALTFQMACVKHPDADFHDAIYLEEYSLLLPVSESQTPWDKGVVFGKWICAGVNISIESFDRVCRLVNWIPGEVLERMARSAGFQVRVRGEAQNDNVETRAEERQKPDKIAPPALPEGRFVLTGNPRLEAFFNDNIVDIVLHREQYARMGISFPGATILHGPPGCGKTYSVEKLCEYLGWKRFNIDSGTIGSSYIHDTSKKIAAVFQDAIKCAPSILVIDEMESFLSSRDMAGPSGLHHMEEVAEFLRRIPEAVEAGVLIFAMTNLIDRIDPAILRRGRFDHIIEITMPSAEEVESLLVAKFANLPTEEIDIKAIAKKLAGHPFSDVTFVLKEAGRWAIKSNKEKIDMDCMRAAMDQLPKKKEKNKIGFV